jgi:phage terminase large subunit GpA-like protein
MKIRVLCPHCGSARIIEYKTLDHKVISCVKSPCRRLFAIVQHCKSIAVYSLQHSGTYVQEDNQ